MSEEHSVSHSPGEVPTSPPAGTYEGGTTGEGPLEHSGEAAHLSEGSPHPHHPFSRPGGEFPPSSPAERSETHVKEEAGEEGPSRLPSKGFAQRSDEREWRMPRLVLASRSPARLATLQAAGIDPIVLVSDVDEDAVIAGLPSDTAPGPMVCALAEAKAQAVARVLTEYLQETRPISGGATTGGSEHTGNVGSERYLVLGCDSMLEIKGRMVGKPHTPQVARERIRDMRNTDSTLWTGHSLIPVEAQEGVWRILSPLTQESATIVHFGMISDEEIDAYVATGEPLQVAGSFTVDGLGGPFVQGVSGDYHAVVGVSLPLVRDLASQAGVFWPDLWNRGSAG